MKLDLDGQVYENANIGDDLRVDTVKPEQQDKGYFNKVKYRDRHAKDVCVYYSGWDIYESQYTLLPTPLASGFKDNFTDGGNEHSQQVLPHWRNAYEDGTLDKITHIYYAFLAIMPTEEEYERMKNNTIYPINFNTYDTILAETDGFKGNGTINDNPDSTKYNSNVPVDSLIPCDWFEFYGLDYTPEEVYDDKGNVIDDLKNPTADWQDWTQMDHHPDIFYEGTLKQLKRVKKLKPNIKILPSVGGWSDCWNFTVVFNDEVRRQRFVKDAVRRIVEWGFDGIDIDWEFPGIQGIEYNYTPKPEDRENFAKLIRELKAEFIRVDSSKEYEVTAAVGAAPENLYFCLDAARELDKISLMSYDYFNFEYSTNQTGLFYNYSEKEQEWNTYQLEKEAGFYTHAGVQYLLRNGIPNNKINIGVALYYRGGKVDKSQLDLDNNRVFADFTGVIPKDVFGVQYGEDNTGDYRAITEADNLDGWRFGTDLIAMGGWAFNEDESYFISYDNKTTTKAKADYIKKYDLNGCIVWDMFGDDPRPEYSLLSILHSNLTVNVRKQFTEVWKRFYPENGKLTFNTPGTYFLRVGDDLPANKEITAFVQGAGGGGRAIPKGNTAYGGLAGEYKEITNNVFNDGDIVQLIVGRGGAGGHPYDANGVGIDGGASIFLTEYSIGGAAGYRGANEAYKGDGEDHNNNSNGHKDTDDDGNIAYGGEASRFSNGGDGNANGADHLPKARTGAGGGSTVLSNKEEDSYGDNAVGGDGGDGLIILQW